MNDVVIIHPYFHLCFYFLNTFVSLFKTCVFIFLHRVILYFLRFEEFDAVYRQVRHFHTSYARDLLTGRTAAMRFEYAINNQYSLFHVFEMLARYF